MAQLKYLYLRSRPLLIIIGLGLIIYGQTINYPFHFDDEIYIVNNKSIRSFDGLATVMETSAHASRYITFLSFALNYMLHTHDVFGYHVVNILIHILNAILVFWLVFLILSTQSMKYESISKAKKEIALCVALIFLAHPLQTQAVTYLTQRFASLATMFYLASVCFYLKGRNVGGRFFVHPVFLAASLLTAIIGMFTKEIVATLAISIILIEVSFLSIGQGRAGFRNQVNWYYILPYILITLIVPAIYAFNVMDTLFAPRVSGSSIGDHLTMKNYFLTQSRVIITYLRLLFVPIGQNLLYDFTLSESIFEIKTFLSFGIILSILFVAFRIHYRHTLMSFGILWFFITLSVESSIIPIQHVIFEHRVYLPMVGFSIFIVAILFEYIKNERTFKRIIIIIVAVLSVLTIARNFVWRSEIALWTDVKKKAPNQARSYLNLGIAYLHEGETDLAMENFNKSLQIDKRSTRAYKNRANTYAAMGKYQEAIDDYGMALAIDPKYAKVYSNRGVLYNEIGQYSKAIKDYNIALKLEPDMAEVYNNRGYTYQKNHQYEEALRDYDKAIELNPRYVRAWINRGEVYKQIGQFDLAIADFSNAILVTPQNYALYYNRASIYALMAEYELALKDFNYFIKKNPSVPVAYFSRSLIYRAQGDYDNALKSAKKALELGYTGIESYIAELQRMR